MQTELDGACEGDGEGSDRRWYGDAGAGWDGGSGKESESVRGRDWECVSLGEVGGKAADRGS